MGKGLSPTQRTLAALRQRGCLAEVVERWIKGARVRKDAFGFGDILAVEPGKPGALLVQCTTGDHVAARIAKINDECADARDAWLDAGNRLEVWGWRRVKLKRGGKAVRWQPRVVTIEHSP